MRTTNSATSGGSTTGHTNHQVADGLRRLANFLDEHAHELPAMRATVSGSVDLGPENPREMMEDFAGLFDFVTERASSGLVSLTTGPQEFGERVLMSAVASIEGLGGRKLEHHAYDHVLSAVR